MSPSEPRSSSSPAKAIDGSFSQAGPGKLTADRPLFRDDPEAVVFARVAREMGVPEASIIVESRSTNTGENVRFTHALLRARGLARRA